MALVTVRASQGGFGVLRKLGPRGLSGPAGGEENFEIRAPFVHSEHDSERLLSTPSALQLHPRGGGGGGGGEGGGGGGGGGIMS